MNLIDKNALIQDIYNDNPKDIMLYISQYPELKIKSSEEKIEWYPIIFRPLSLEEKEMFKNEEYYIESVLPDDGEEVLISYKNAIFIDRFDADYNNFETLEIIECQAWASFPKPYKKIN